MQHMQITPFSKQPQAGSDCGFATFGKHPTVHPDIVWAKLVFFNSCLFIQLSAAINQTNNLYQGSMVEGARLAADRIK